MIQKPPISSSNSDSDASRRWDESPRGRRLTAIEQHQVGQIVPELFGRHFLQIGQWGSGDWLQGSEMLHRAVLATASLPGAQARIDSHHLPLASKTVDALLLPHTLEFADSPHTVLREASRVLTDRGRLLLLGFNPWSALGWRRRLGLAPRALPRRARFYSPGRVSDWLSLLDFEIAEVRRFSVGFPWLPPRADNTPFSPAVVLHPFAEAYLISAKKRVTLLNLVGRVARAQVKPLIGMPGVARRDAEPDGPPP